MGVNRDTAAKNGESHGKTDEKRNGNCNSGFRL